MMGSARERRRSEESFGVAGRQLGFQGCLLSSAPGALATDRLEGRGRGQRRMQCQKAAAPGAGQRRAQPPPPASLPLVPGTGTPRSQRAGAYVRPLTLLRGIPGVPGASVPGKMPDRLPSPPLSPFRKSFKPGHNPDAPVPPRPLSSPGAEAASRPAPSSAPTRPWTLVSKTTWEDSPGGQETPEVTHCLCLPGGPLGRQRSGRPTRTSVASN